jgi:hypothetical protein
MVNDLDAVSCLVQSIIRFADSGQLAASALIDTIQFFNA